MEFSTDMFFWDKEDGEFRQEVSSLELKPSQDFFNGITLRNPKTSGKEHFIFDKSHHRSGDLTHWTFKSHKHNLKMTIWND